MPAPARPAPARPAPARPSPTPTLRSLPLSALKLRGERALRSIGLYEDLKRLLIEDDFRFRVPEVGSVHATADRVLFLNLTFWGAGEASDVLVEPVLDADVLTHAAWHHAARRALADGATPSAAALFLGEAVASAFDAYLVGQLLRQGKQTDFLKTQLPAMTEAMLGAGLEEEAVQALFARMAEDPDAAFEALRGLLFEVSLALYRAPDLDAAAAVLAAAAEHPFAGLLHHYALSAWVLYARAYAGPGREADPAVELDRALRAAPVALDHLARVWLRGGG